MKEKMVLHVCCGPCSLVPVEILQDRFDIHGYWFNPNIHPRAEYEKRLQAAGYALQRLGVPTEYNLAYDITAWFVTALGVSSKKARCRACYEMRLFATAQYAAAHGYEIFATTMAQSPYQDFDAIAAAGDAAGRAAGVTFCREDFRMHYHKGKARAREWGIYRQNYCGCLFSELERKGLDGQKFSGG